jgi:hypothetical protein
MGGACSKNEEKRKAYRLLIGKPEGKRSLNETKTKLHGLSPRSNYTDRGTAACRRSDCQLLRIEGATWSE